VLIKSHGSKRYFCTLTLWPVVTCRIPQRRRHMPCQKSSWKSSTSRQGLLAPAVVEVRRGFLSMNATSQTVADQPRTLQCRINADYTIVTTENKFKHCASYYNYIRLVRKTSSTKHVRKWLCRRDSKIIILAWNCRHSMSITTNGIFSHNHWPYLRVCLSTSQTIQTTTCQKHCSTLPRNFIRRQVRFLLFWTLLQNPDLV
jgi:hypothetical protein